MRRFPLIYAVWIREHVISGSECVRLFVNVWPDGRTRSGFEPASTYEDSLESLLGGTTAFFGENNELGLALGATDRASLVDPFGRFPRPILPCPRFPMVLERVQVQQRRDRLVQSVCVVLNAKILLMRFSRGLRPPALGGALSR